MHLNEQRLHTHWQQKVFTKLLGLNYKIVYRRGVDNGAADALSRRPSTNMALALSSVTPQWLEDVCNGYQSDPEALDILSRLTVSGASDSHFTLSHGLICYDNKIWLGSNTSLQQLVFAALHSSALGGHSGAPATYHRIRHM